LKLNKEAEKLYRVQEYGPKPSIEGVALHDLPQHGDAFGSLTELLRLEAGKAGALGGLSIAQINYSTLEPGAIKAFHVHRRQTDVWFVPPGDRVLLILADVREGSEGARQRLLLGGGRSRLVVIPPGVAHGCRNVGTQEATIVYFTDVHFSPEPSRTDEGRLPWDFLGADVWEIPPE
jgi:dTDP-4-dehydrorhamnose 3,5-epimerase